MRVDRRMRTTHTQLVRHRQHTCTLKMYFVVAAKYSKTPDDTSNTAVPKAAVGVPAAAGCIHRLALDLTLAAQVHVDRVGVAAAADEPGGIVRLRTANRCRFGCCRWWCCRGHLRDDLCPATVANLRRGNNKHRNVVTHNYMYASMHACVHVCMHVFICI